MPDPIPIITDAADLEAFCGRMAKETYITLDTEFMRRTTYYRVLCLVQIAGESYRMKDKRKIGQVRPRADAS